MSESWWELPDPPDAKAKSGDERAVTRRREKLMVNADVKLLVREALDPIETGLIKMRALMKQVRDERDNARAKVEELEHEGRLAAKTTNHLTYVNKLRRFCRCRLLALPTPRCKGPCLPVPGPIPRAGSLCIALLAVARRRRRCFRCLSRQLAPLPPLLRHRASCRCAHCSSARRQPSLSQALRICSCLPLCRSLPSNRLLRLPLPTPRRPLLRLTSPLLTTSLIFKVKVTSCAAHCASSSARSAAHTAATPASCAAQRAISLAKHTFHSM